MRIVFVRHGHPNYRDDCLTELGHIHAKAAAERLMGEGITEIHASSCGRALETAQHTAERLGLEVHVHDFMREISWGAADGGELFRNGHPWFTADEMVLQGENLMRTDWKESERFRRNIVLRSVEKVEAGIDEWLRMLGYEREGAQYRVVGTDTDRTVAMFSHGGSSSAAIGHMMNLPFPYLCVALTPGYTAITILTLSDVQGTLTIPRFEIANDSRHIQACENVLSN